MSDRLSSITRSPRYGALITAGLVLLLLLPLWWLGGQWYQSRLLAEQRAQVAADVALHVNALSLAIERRFAPLEALAAFVQAEMDDGELGTHFATFAAGLYADSPQIRSLALAPDGVIRFVYPPAGNESLLDYAPAQDDRANVRADAQRALDTGEVVLTGPIELIQGGVGLIARRAVYRPDGIVWGLVNVAVNLPPILEEAGLSTQSGGLEVAVRDETGHAIFGAGGVWSHDPVVQSVRLPEGEWQLAGLPEGGWAAAVQLPLLVFQGATLVIVALLAGLTYASVNRQLRLASAVHERTRDISRINDQLEQDLTERQRVEAELRVSEGRYRTLARNFPNGAVILFDHDLRYLLADGAGLAEVGLSQEMLEGKTIWEIFSPEVTALLEPRYRAALAGTPSTFEVPFADHMYLLHVLPIHDEHGAISGGMVMTQNVTERKRAEEALRVSEARNRAMVNAIPDLLLRMSRDGVYLDFHAERISDLTFPPDVLIGMNIRDTTIERALLERVLANIYAALDTGVVQTLEYSLTLADGLHDYEARCVASGPDEVVVIVRDITERKRAEEIVLRSQQQYEQLVNTIDSIVWEGDARTFAFSFVSRQAERLLGYPVERWLNEPDFWADHIHPGDRAWALNFCVRATAEKRPHEFEYRMIAADGRTVWLRDIVTVVVEADQPILLRGVMIDITERKRAEAALARWAHVFEHAEWGVAVGSADGQTLELLNPAYARMHGYRVEELIGQPIASLFAPGAEAELSELIRLANETGHAVAEQMHIRKDGSTFPVLVDLTAVRDEAGQLLYRVANVQDITERKRVEAELQASEERFRSLVEISPVGVIILSPEGTFRYVSPAYERHAGYSAVDLIGQPVFMVVHPDDLPLIGERFAFLIQHPELIATAEYRHIRKDGSVRIMDATGTVLPNGDIVGYVQDITERRQAEEALRTSESRSRALLNAIPDLMFRLNRDGTFLDFRADPKDMVIPPESVIGSNIRHITMPPEVVDRIMDKIHAALDTGQMQTLEYALHTAGGPRDFEARIVTCGPDEVVAVVRDVTEQARAYELLEQRVQERTHELSTLLHVSRHLTSTLEIEAVLGQFLDHLRNIIDFTHATLVALEGETIMRVRAYRGSFSPEEVLAIGFTVRHSLDQQIIATRRPVLIADVHADTDEAREFRAGRSEKFMSYFAATHCHMRVPLVVKDKVAGVLTLHHPQPDHYGAHEVELALAFADQAAAAMENARLFEATQRRAEQFRVIGEMGYRITSILAVDALLAQTVRLIQETYCYYHIHIGLIEQDRIVFKREAGLWRDEGQCMRCEALELRLGPDSLSGRVAQSGEPLLIPDVSHDPRFIALAPNPTGSELVLPLTVKGSVIGVLDLESEQVNAFDAGDVTVLQSFANQTAVAIENARLYEQSQQLAALEERQKLARELHDSVSQALYGIALGARTARTQLDRDSGQAAEPLDYVLSLSEAALAEMRALIFELRPESLETEGLVAALEKQAASLRARHHLDVRLVLCGEPNTSLEVKQALYRIAQEALHNIVKHARASRVDLVLQQTEAGLALEVRDNGRGFDAGQSFPGHLGLQSMRERAERLGGVFEVTSAPGEGAHLCVRIPGPNR